MEKIKNRLLTALFGIATALLVITFSIGLPIYFRPFYYMQIEPLGIPERTGFDYDTVKSSYDELLDYLTVPGNEFSTGAFAHSEDGKSHFEDCKVLFDLNICVLLASLSLIIILKLLEWRGVFKMSRPFGLDVGFSVGSFTLAAFAILALLVSMNFDLAFEIFHAVLFPGKDNWIFNPRLDPIIGAMPAQFFMNCAILIVSSIIILTAAMIAVSLLKKKFSSVAKKK